MHRSESKFKLKLEKEIKMGVQQKMNRRGECHLWSRWSSGDTFVMPTLETSRTFLLKTTILHTSSQTSVFDHQTDMGESQSRDPGHTSKDRFTPLPVAQVFPSARTLKFLHMPGPLPEGGDADEQNKTAIRQQLRTHPSLFSCHVLTTATFCPCGQAPSHL